MPTFKPGDRVQLESASHTTKEARGAEGTVRRVSDNQIYWVPDDLAVIEACRCSVDTFWSWDHQLTLLKPEPFDVDAFAKYLKSDV